MNEKFEKNYRLLTSPDYEYLKSGSLSYSGKLLLIYFRTSKSLLNNSRMGITVPKKVAPSCHRNYMKRVIRENFRKSPYKHLGTDFNFVVKARSYNSRHYSRAELFSILSHDVNFLLKKIRDVK